MKNHFDILLLIARPAAGKSEIIDFLKSTPLSERIKKFHVAEFKELDDFPILWRWFEEDQLLSEMGHQHLFTDEKGYFLFPDLWNLLIRLLCLDYNKLLRDSPDFHQDHSLIFEFSRGSEHGGYREAFKHISREIIENMAVLYIDVLWEESLRKNRRRFNPDKPDSILEHGLPDEKLEKLYRENDWEEVRKENSEYLQIEGVQVPYVVFYNQDDVTSQKGQLLEKRLEESLQKLWELKTRK